MKSAIGNRKSAIAFTLVELPAVSKGFTLVELLVFITIIVVLLALLAPALDRAVYQAELAVCGARQNGVVTATLTYATGNRRFYPVNANRRGGGYQPDLIGYEAQPTFDLRPVLKPYLGLESWLDPLVGRVDLSEVANDTDTQVFSSYDYWGGWQYTGPLAVSQGAMIKLGDKVAWTDNVPTGGGPQHVDSATFLVSDRNGVHGNNNVETSSHPDFDGELYQSLRQNDPQYLGGLSAAGFGASTLNVTLASWINNQTAGIPRGLLDLNFGYADGSVERYDQVTGNWLTNDFESRDRTRFHGAPWMADSNQAIGSAKRWVPTAH